MSRKLCVRVCFPLKHHLSPTDEHRPQPFKRWFVQEVQGGCKTRSRETAPHLPFLLSSVTTRDSLSRERRDPRLILFCLFCNF